MTSMRNRSAPALIVTAPVRPLNGTLEVGCRTPRARFMLILPNASDDSHR